MGQTQNQLSVINLASSFSPATPIKIEHAVTQNGSRYKVFLRLYFSESMGDIPNYTLNFDIRPGYTSKTILAKGTLEPGRQSKKAGRSVYYELSLDSIPDEALMTVFYNSSESPKALLKPFHLSSTGKFPAPDIVVMDAEQDVPILRGFVTPEDTISLRAPLGSSSQFFVFYYAHDFEPAYPPMTTGDTPPPKSLEIAWVRAFEEGQKLIFDEPGMYFIQTDTSSLAGLTIRSENPYFPQYVKAEQLVEPLIYISTNLEMDKLSRSTNTKAALDEYWLELSPNRERARAIIRNYYAQTERANMFFTNYKEGWKTDRGLIYIVFGAPDEVYRDEKEEYWNYYISDKSKISFRFVKIKNIFTDDHYQLARKRTYDRYWFRNVDLWRKGRKAI